ncbi:AMP-binding protein [Leucobacter sp. wl10]|uniref:AMP-binding protein n=1 Tax=Leucobacter sp. wl10 TaxID=2304677 RepID=UPI000E5B383F|nr:AMP-binding protein [Leucobacter sp. wl10]RGE24217.1 long-chain fatty acid--CoA ligase [Leucobacter sp. wl10]
MPITQTVLEVAERDPHRPAVVGLDGRLSYAELVADSRRAFAVVDALHREQAAPPRPAPETGGIPITAVSVESAFHASRLVGGLAGFRSVSAVIDPRWPAAHRVELILSTGIGVVISDCEELAAELSRRGWGGVLIGLDDFRRREEAVEPAPPPSVRAGDETFLMLCSSGTTSNPKAFLKTRRQYRENVAVSAAHLEPLPGTATLAPGPVSYSLTLYAVIECLATGGGAHVADAFDAIEAGRRIRDERVTRVVAVPAAVQALADAARRHPERFETLELVVTGGANLSRGIRGAVANALPRARLISYYGAAEIGFIGDSRDGDGTLITIYEGIGASIRDEAGAELPEGEPGTLWIRAEACSDGYLSGTTDAVLRGPDGWATVHDQGRMVGGRLELIGRDGDIVVSGGHKVALPEVERAFEGMPGLGAVCAVGVEHAGLGSVVALVVEGGAPVKGELAARARARLAPQFVPRRWYVVDRLPRTVGGKVRRVETAELVAGGAAVRL